MVGFINLDKEFVKVFLKTAVTSVVFFILWIPVYCIRCFIVLFISKAKPSYGKILDHVDCSMEEKYSEKPPRNSLVFLLTLEGSLELKELRRLFLNNVLGATITNKKTGEDEPRYPEFKQYQTEFAGFTFWKNDETFNVDNHITEQPYNEKFASVSKIHQEMINKLFEKKRSPWEMILVPKYKNEEKTLIIFRTHHTMADTKSCLKVFVEFLGEKKLVLPEPRYKSKSLIDSILFYILLPFYFVFSQVVMHYVAIKGDDSPFKFKSNEEPLLQIGVSQKISLNDAKLIGKRNNVTTSAVIMSAMAGGIAKSDPRHERKEIPTMWILPKPNHPVRLMNHHYSGTIDLPTNELSNRDRLQKCNGIFMLLKNSNLYVYDKLVLFVKGTFFNPIRFKLLRKGAFPLILTNIAAEREGFQIGGRNVIDLSMTCGPPVGGIGAIITAFSYKDAIEITATVKAGVLTESQTQRLADLIAKEMQVLKNV